MKTDEVLNFPMETTADIKAVEDHVLRKMGRHRRKKGRKIAHALALLWPQPESSHQVK